MSTVGISMDGIEKAKLGRFTANENTGIVKTGIAGMPGIGKLIPGIVICRSGKLHFEGICKLFSCQ